ncbi:DsbA family protein [Candidatus Uhrbacteria bacterium]|nr:DsbA family protein [Candidatus Uhrbacteria bacterium]
MEAIQTDEVINRKRSWIATVVTLLVLALLIAFASRVFYFASRIKSGEIDLSTYNFTDSFTSDLALSNTVVTDGEFDLVTTDDPNLGNPDAPLTIVEFADFQCPYSQEVSFVMRELAAKYPEEIYYVYRDLPLTDIHPLAEMAAQAGECAHEQDKFWEYHDKLYQKQSSLTEDSFVTFARELNLNVDQFESCLAKGRYNNEVQEDLEAGVAAGVRGTPTFFINGNLIAGSIPKDVMEAIVKSVTSSP